MPRRSKEERRFLLKNEGLFLRRQDHESSRQENSISLESLFHDEVPADLIVSGDSKYQLREKISYVFGKYQEVNQDIVNNPDIRTKLDQRLDLFSFVDNDSLAFIRMDKAEYIANFLLSPSRDVAFTQHRQRAIESIQQSPQLEELFLLQETAVLKILGGVSDLTASRGFGKSDERSLLERFRHGDTIILAPEEDEYSDLDDEIDSDDYEDEDTVITFETSNGENPKGILIQPLIDTAIQDINEGLSALSELVETFSNQANSHLRSFAQEIRQSTADWKQTIHSFIPLDATSQRTFSRAFFGQYSNLMVFSEKVIKPKLFQIATLIELAKKMKDENWSKVTFEKNKPRAYAQAWNVEKKPQVQVKNNSPEDFPSIILAGANTSGKSFFLHMDFYIQVFAQSTGFAPAQSANIQHFDTLVYSDRGKTDSANDLSAFMNEIHHLNQFLLPSNSRMRVYMDETFSTTSPEDQAFLLSNTAEYLIDQGGSIFLATHNELFLKAHSKKPGTKLYHLATKLSPKGELDRSFLLKSGVQKPFSLEVARMRNFPTHILDSAEKYLEGNHHLPKATLHKSTEFQKPRLEEREHAKKMSRSLEHLFPKSPDQALFTCLSNDTDFNVNVFLQKLKHQEKYVGFEMLSLYSNLELISQYILWNSEKNPAEILERQKLFSELLNNSLFKELKKAANTFPNLHATLNTLSKTVEKGWLTSLHPFSGKKNQFERMFAVENIQIGISFLVIRHSLLGPQFAEEVLKRELEDLLQELNAEPNNRQNEKLIARWNAAFENMQTLSGDVELHLIDVPIEQLREPLEVLKNSNNAAEALLQISSQLENLHDFTTLLKTTDSIYLHQESNLIEEEVSKALTGLTTVQEDSNNFALQESPADLSKITQTVRHISALCLLADIIKTENFAQVDFQPKNGLEITHNRSIFKTQGKSVTNPVQASPDQKIQLLTGPNGSGKTFYEKSIVASVLWGMATGYAPAESAKLPFYDSVIYLDRVTTKSDGVSSFAQEIEYWKVLLTQLERNTHSFVVVDEAFSTTSPEIQAALIHGIVAHVATTPHTLLLSTHNHAVADTLLNQRGTKVAAKHLGFKTHDGKIQYTYRLQAGHEGSRAKEVARMMGFPEKILNGSQLR